MKVLLPWLGSALIAVAHAGSDIAKAYIIGSSYDRTTSEEAILTPAEARLVLAQRLGVSRYHDLYNVDDAALSVINDAGGDDGKLFLSAKTTTTSSQHVIIAEGAGEKMMDLLSSSFVEAFQISNPPSAVDNQLLAADLAEQIYDGRLRKGKIAEAISFSRSTNVGGNAQISYIDLAADALARSKLEKLITGGAGEASDRDIEYMLVAMPATKRSHPHEHHSYGDYDMPAERDVAGRQVEEPFNNSEDFLPLETTPQQSKQQEPSARPHGIVPLCHSKMELCVSATNNCSGHGECYRKYGPEDGGCYTCRCGKDTIDGKTTYWSGSTCAKKDISAQFWLLAGFTIVIVGVVSWAIGMLFSVGEEKLPGVIGAGVSGPKAR